MFTKERFCYAPLQATVLGSTLQLWAVTGTVCEAAFKSAARGESTGVDEVSLEGRKGDKAAKRRYSRTEG